MGKRRETGLVFGHFFFLPALDGRSTSSDELAEDIILWPWLGWLAVTHCECKAAKAHRLIEFFIHRSKFSPQCYGGIYIE